jgi:hypothetical protein
MYDTTLRAAWEDLTFGPNVDFVNNNPGAFANAYFEFNSVKVYE